MLGHRAMGCQGRDRTSAFRVTAGRLPARLPGTSTATGNRTPLSGLRARCLGLLTIAACPSTGEIGVDDSVWCAPWASNPVSSGVRARCPTSQAWRASVGREGIEPPVSEDGWSTASRAPWRDRPIARPGGAGPDKDASAVVKVRTPGRESPARARPEGIEPLAGGVGDRGATMARAQELVSMLTGMRPASERAVTQAEPASYQRAPGLPVSADFRGPGRCS